MTSSVHDLSSDSDDDRNDEQKKAPEEQVQHSSPATGKSHADLGSPSVENVTPQYLEVGHMVQAAFPYPDPYYRSIFNPYGARPMMYPQLVGIKAGVPLPSDATEEPVFVNAKQYHGILRRRQSRAKAESENKVIKPRKPYVHESRHLHAMKRSRDGEGRFINAKTNKKQQTEIASGDNAETDNTTQDSSNHVS